MDIQKEIQDFENWAFQASGGWASFTKDSYGKYWPDKLNLAWEAWKAAKNQAVPEGSVLLPCDVVDRCMSHIVLAQCHPNNTSGENDVMEMDLKLLEQSIEKAQEQNYE